MSKDTRNPLDYNGGKTDTNCNTAGLTPDKPALTDETDGTDSGREDDSSASTDEHEEVGPSGPGHISPTNIHDQLRNERRQLVIRKLATSEDTTVADLADHVAAVENDVESIPIGSQERKAVYVGLYQCHIPNLAEAGIVDYDKDRGIVSRGPEYVTAHTVLEQTVDTLEDPPEEIDRGVDSERRSLTERALSIAPFFGGRTA